MGGKAILGHHDWPNVWKMYDTESKTSVVDRPNNSFLLGSYYYSSVFFDKIVKYKNGWHSKMKVSKLLNF